MTTKPEEAKQTETTELLSPETGTATSSPKDKAAISTDKLFATLWYMKKEANQIQLYVLSAKD